MVQGRHHAGPRVEVLRSGDARALSPLVGRQQVRRTEGSSSLPGAGRGGHVAASYDPARTCGCARSAPSTAVPSCKTPPGLSAAGFSPSRAGRQAPIHGVPSMEGLPSAMMGAPPGRRTVSPTPSDSLAVTPCLRLAVTLPRSQRSVPNSPAGSSPHVSSSPVARATNSPLLRPFASGNEAGGDHDAAAQEEEVRPRREARRRRRRRQATCAG